MAIIPEYQRKTLESRAVGTPGVDTSGQQIGQSVAKAAAGVAQEAGNIAVQRQEAKDAAYANKTLIQADLEFDNLWDEHKSKNAEFRGAPGDRVKAFQSTLETRAKDIVDTMPSGAARNAVEQNIWNVIGRKLNQERSFADQNQAVLGFNDSITSANLLGTKAGKVASDPNFSLEDKRVILDMYMKQGESTYKIFAPIVSPEQREKLKTGIPEIVSKGFLTAAIDENPAEAMAALDAGWFDQTLNGEERSKLRKAAISSLENQRQTEDINYFASQIQANQGLYDKYLAGTLTYAELAQAPDQRFADKLNDLRIKAKPYTAADRFNTYMERYAEYMDAVKGKGQDAKSRVPLDKLLELQMKIADDVNEGKMDADTGGSLMKNLAVPAAKKLKSAGNWFSDFGKMSQPFQTAYNFVRTEAKKSDLPASVQAETLMMFQRDLPTLGPEPTPEAVNKLIRGSYKQAVHKSFPGLVLPDENTTRLMTANGQDIRLAPAGEKPAKKVTKDYQLVIDPVSKIKMRKYPDGRFEKPSKDEL